MKSRQLSRAVSSARNEKKPTATSVVEAIERGEAPDKRGLGAIADGLNAQFQRVEAIWSKRFSAGAAICILEDDEVQEMHSLAFRRRGNRWELLIDEQHYEDHDSEHIATMPLVSASLHLRVKAAGALKSLEERLEKERLAQAKLLADTLVGLTAFADGLTQEKSS